MSEIGWLLFFAIGVSILLARMFIPPADNQFVMMRRFIISLFVLFVTAVWVFILIYDHYQNLNVQLKERGIGLYQKALLRNLSVAQE